MGLSFLLLILSILFNFESIQKLKSPPIKIFSFVKEVNSNLNLLMKMFVPVYGLGLEHIYCTEHKCLTEFSILQ